MGLRYEFRVIPLGETLVVAIRAIGPEGLAFQAALSGRRREHERRRVAGGRIAQSPLVALKTDRRDSLGSACAC